MKEFFFNYQAQTTTSPLALEISHAKGSYIYDTSDKKYLDFIAGVSVNSLGHNHPKIVEAIKNQLNYYTHVMVYGEFIQKPQLELCKLLSTNLPDLLSTTYLTNSGTEATEGALKLAKRFTGRSELIACKNAYHGNTQGSMSVCGLEKQNSAYRPLIPGVKFIEFNNKLDLEKITINTAGVILETIQGAAGFIVPKKEFMQEIKNRCKKVGALLILDEIQSGIGRTGKLFDFQNYNIVPDILIAGKGMGGGMPIGAFISSKKIMDSLKEHPKLGHITTFGGHPVIAAAALATLTEIISSDLMKESLKKEKIIRSILIHPLIQEVRGKGLMLAVIVENSELASKIILKCMDKGLLLFWLLFEKNGFRITPPLTISYEEIKKGCAIIIETLNEISQEIVE